MDVVELVQNKEAVCRRILDGLPQWFGIAAAKEAYVHAAGDLPMFACMVDGEVVGFLTLKVHNLFTSEIHCMGILPECHRHGFGTRLIQRAERDAKEKGMRFLAVKTLAPSKPDENYASTRRFYRAVGFVPLEELPELWAPGNPCLIMVKSAGD